MKTKKSNANSVTTRTWILFGIFLVTSYFCLKVAFAARKITESIVYPTPVTLQIPTQTKTVTPVHKVVK